MSMQQLASGHMSLRLIESGATVSMRFDVRHGASFATAPAAALFQIFNPDDNTVTPAWTPSAPVHVKAVASYGGADVTAKLTGHKWFYNGQQITSANAAANGFADYTTGTLKITKNLASATNTDNDVIEYEGTLAVTATQNVTVRHSATVEVASNANGVYLGVITPGEVFLDDANPTAQLRAQLFLGATEVTSFAVRWRVLDTYLNPDPVASGSSLFTLASMKTNALQYGEILSSLGAGDANLQKKNDILEVKRDMINGQGVVVAMFSVNEGGTAHKVEQASAIVTDLADDVQLVITSNVGENVPRGSNAVLTAALWKGETPFTPVNSVKWEMKGRKASSLNAVVVSSQTNTLTVTTAHLDSAQGQMVVTALADWSPTT